MTDHELEPSLRALLDGERAWSDARLEHHEAIRTRIEASLEGAPLMARVPAGETSPAAKTAIGSVLKGALLLAIGAGAGALLQSMARPSARMPAELPASAPVVVDGQASADGGSPSAPSVDPSSSIHDFALAPSVPTPRPRAPARAAHSVPAAPTAAATASAMSVTADEVSPKEQTHRGASTLGAERALVERGRAALARRDGVSALEALQEHKRTYALGALAEERDALIVQSLAVAGHPDDARAKAREFSQRYPSSVFSMRVDEIVRELR